MVAFFRQILVVLLVSLQFAAPLVHAHVDDSNPMFGLHLHEFESLSPKSDAVMAAALDNVHAVQGAIVEMGAAIEMQQTLDDGKPVYCLLADVPQCTVRFIVEKINFSPQPFFAVSEPFLTQNHTRAPPA